MSRCCPFVSLAQALVGAMITLHFRFSLACVGFSRFLEDAGIFIYFTQRVKYIPKHGTIMHKCSRLVLVGRHGRPNSAHGQHDRQLARQERLDPPKSRISLNSRSHADNISVTQTVSVFEFISSIKIDEMIPRMSALALQSSGAL